MSSYPLVFAAHATFRMAQRSISVAEVKSVIDNGEVIEDYPSDTPFPSRLVLGWRGSNPIHVVAADNHTAKETIIITAYVPTSAQWQPDFKRRKP